ncbi:MAG: hypothetical protein KDB26_10435, partial [Microthrixaceae bacterium]|nr:hypothetical protein [Microthrixaceae bacterium]
MSAISEREAAIDLAAVRDHLSHVRSEVRSAADARCIAAAEAKEAGLSYARIAEILEVTKSAAAQFVAEGLSNPNRARESSQHPHVSRTRTGVTSPATTRPSAVQQRNGR